MIRKFYDEPVYDIICGSGFPSDDYSSSNYSNKSSASSNHKRIIKKEVKSIVKNDDILIPDINSASQGIVDMLARKEKTKKKYTKSFRNE